LLGDALQSCCVQGNVALNSERLPPERSCVGVALDWGVVAKDPAATACDLGGTFDVIFGTDVVYQRADIELIVEVLRGLLRADGAFVSHPTHACFHLHSFATTPIVHSFITAMCRYLPVGIST
jgi:hypothetical protein